MIKKYLSFYFLLLFLISCNRNTENADAYGNFEAVETIVASEASGKILEFNVEEGRQLDSGQVIGIIDTVELHLKLNQLQATMNATASKTGNITAQIEVLEQQRKNLEVDEKRIANLYAADAAPKKQLDDINGQISVIDQQIKSIETQNTPVASEIESIKSQYKQIQDQIAKSIIHNPVTGTVLSKYAEPGEITAFGKPLYKIANLDTMILRVYVSGSQLPTIKIGQQVRVMIDKNSKENTELKGSISWISSNAEFTPKIIQTKDERVNLVYAVKVQVKNDGSLKIGMPGEIKLQ